MSVRKKNGGREIGTPNKLTKVHREFVQTLLDNQTTKIETELSSLSGKEYLSVILSLMDFAIPKLSRIEMLDERDNNLTHIIIEGKKFAQKETETAKMKLPDGTKIEI